MERSCLHSNRFCIRGATVAALLAALSSGCLSSYLGPEGDGVPRFVQSSSPDHAMDLSLVPAAPPSDGASFWGDFASEAGRIARDMNRRTVSTPLIEGLAAETQPGYEAVLAGSGGLMAEEDSRRLLAKGGRTEMMRVVRKALNGAIRRQALYDEVREILRVGLGGSPITRLEPGPVLEDPALDDSYGASRLFRGASTAGLRAPSPDDIDTSINLGMYPRVGIRWMRLYRFSYEPRSREMVHRLEYGLGPVGVGAAYKVRQGEATDVGIGLQMPVGPMSAVTLSAGQTLRGAEAGEDGESGGRTVMAELVCRF
jgi:hypothetical protein